LYSFILASHKGLTSASLLNNYKLVAAGLQPRFSLLRVQFIPRSTDCPKESKILKIVILLGCDPMKSDGGSPVFLMNILPVSSGSKVSEASSNIKFCLPFTSSWLLLDFIQP
jgi:hypothetical protein